MLAAEIYLDDIIIESEKLQSLAIIQQVAMPLKLLTYLRLKCRKLTLTK